MDACGVDGRKKERKRMEWLSSINDRREFVLKDSATTWVLFLACSCQDYKGSRYTIVEENRNNGEESYAFWTSFIWKFKFPKITSDCF
jgi:hypothetical protein